MDEKFVDYFEVCGLDPQKSRRENYEDLRKMHHKAGMKSGPAGELEELLLSQAMSIFIDESRYQEFLAEHNRRRKKSEKADQQVKDNTSGDVQQETDVPQEDFWSVLGKVALKGIESYLENKQPQTEQQSGQPRTQRQGLGNSLSGLWRDSGSGGQFRIQQYGNTIRVQGLDGYGQVVVEGQGLISGRTIQYEARNAAGQVGRGEFSISRDVMRIEGNISWWNYNMLAGTFYIRLLRQ
jgi:hypothetical protein